MATPFLIPMKNNNNQNNNFALSSHRYVSIGDGPKGYEPIPGSVRFLCVQCSMFVVHRNVWLSPILFVTTFWHVYHAAKRGSSMIIIIFRCSLVQSMWNLMYERWTISSNLAISHFRTVRDMTRIQRIYLNINWICTIFVCVFVFT